MADDSRFKYKEIASKVLKQERSGVARNEPSGESERLTTADLRNTMGSAVRDRAKTEAVKVKRKKEDDAVTLAAKRVARNAYEELTGSGATYNPSTKATERAWEGILTFVSQCLPAVSRDVLTSAAEELLNAMKDSERPAKDKRKAVNSILGDISDEDFRTLFEKAEQITDFVVQLAEAETRKKRSRDSEIAIVFDDEDDEDEEKLAPQTLEEDVAVEAEVVSSESEEDEDMDENTRVRRNRGADEGEGMDMDDPLIDPHTIDAYWLQREVAATTTDSNEAQRLSESVLEMLKEKDASIRENLLVSNLGFERLDLVKKLMRNRATIYYCTRLAKAINEDEREKIRAEMMEDPTAHGEQILQGLAGISVERPAFKKGKHETEVKETLEEEIVEKKKRHIMPSSRVIDLQSLSRINPRQLKGPVQVPKGTITQTTKSWEEVHVRPLKPRPLGPNETIVRIDTLPNWMKPAFAGMTELNRVQSKVFPAMVNSERFNVLVSAPTGSGKTNVAMLAVMNEVGQFVNEDGVVDKEALKEKLKIVYVAPMKALVQEVVANFSARLTEDYGIKVRELSGDQQLSRAELASTQMIVTTPEKWDVVTRKAGERSFVSTVRLIIIDEIHLLHDARGAVLEAVVARTLRANEETRAPCRLLGISATLPNYEDVAEFLRVPMDRGLFFFDNSFRPVPLQQIFIGVTDRKAFNRARTMDQVCYEKVSKAARSNQVLVFVHSRKDTVRTARMMRDAAVENNTQQDFLPPGVHSREVLSRCATGALTGREDEDAKVARSQELRDLLPYGFAVHHAGMHRSDRSLVEDLFADGHVRVLVSTATLAWGVNLPAHTVVIKGTQVYSPETGGWTELSHLDLLQMLGRAGRPQFDQDGAEGIVITSRQEMEHYLSLLNNQLPVESSLMKRLPEHLNAECVCGNVADIADAITWLSYSFLLVRAAKHPERYGIFPLTDKSLEEEDPHLQQWSADIANAAFQVLDKHQLVRYDKRTGVCQTAPLGRIASHYYISAETCGAFTKLLEPTATDIDLLRILTVADEFKQIQVRYEEKAELSKLVERVPVPIKEDLEDPSAKINVLLQAYISRSHLDGYCLSCDMVYVHQSAARLARALFEMCLMKNWAQAARKCLSLCVSVDKRLWASQTPLRQVQHSSPLLTEDVMRQLEKRALHFSQYRELNAAELGAKLNPPTLGSVVQKAIRRFPTLNVAARVQTLTRTVLRLEVALSADFEYYEPMHGPGVLYWVMVEDVDGLELLHHEPFFLKGRFASEEHIVTVTVQISEPTPPFVFVRVEADGFLHASSSLAVPLMNLTLPPKAPPFSELLDMAPILVTSLPPHQRKYVQRVHPHITQLWPSQTQAYSLVDSDAASVLICCPLGKSLLGELAIVNALHNDPQARIVYTCSSEAACDIKGAFLEKALDSFVVRRLRGIDQTADIQALTESNVSIVSSAVWEVLTRRWKQKSRRVVSELSLLVCDDLHAMDDAMEVALSRTRYMCTQLDRHIRIVGLATSLSNADEVAAWLDAKKVVNLPPSARPFSTEIVVRGFADQHFETRMGAMARPCYRLIKRNERTVIFVPAKRYLRLLLVDLVSFASADGKPFANSFNDPSELAEFGTEARSALGSGVAILHESMSPKDFANVQRAYADGKVRLVVVSARCVYNLDERLVRAQHAILLGTTWFQNKRYEEYPFPMLQNMLNKACLAPVNQQTVLCYEPTKAYYKRFLVSGLYLESSLDQSAPDIILAEIVSKTIETKQDAIDFFTWTFFYRRLVKNPSYYGMFKRANVPQDQALSLFLSDLVERVLEELAESKCLENIEGQEEREEEEAAQKLIVSPLGLIAAFHNVKTSTVDLFASSLQPKTRIAGLLEILSSASEYLEKAAVRAKEELVLEKLARQSECVIHKLPGGSEGLNFTEAHVKCNVLLQAWCSRFPLSVDQREDLTLILKDAPHLLHALVDVSAMHSWLKVTLGIVELCQSIVQQVWSRDPALRQIPYYDTHLGDRFIAAKVQSVYDLIDMDDDKREELLSVLDQNQLARVAEFCNAYPSPQVQFKVLVDGHQVATSLKGFREVPANSEVLVHVSFARDEEADEDENIRVVADKFPHAKTNVWWAILGDTQSNELIAIKRLVDNQAKLTWSFEQPNQSRQLKLYIVCDSYVGCDQVFDLQLEVAS